MRFAWNPRVPSAKMKSWKPWFRRQADMRRNGYHFSSTGPVMVYDAKMGEWVIAE